MKLDIQNRSRAVEIDTTRNIPQENAPRFFIRLRKTISHQIGSYDFYFHPHSDEFIATSEIL